MLPSGRAKIELYWLWGGGLLMCGLVLLPWWRNRDYLRDFYDYGSFMSANARLATGERPYVDFGTPIQSAMYLGNYAAERMGGGTYLGMTWGAAVLGVLGFFSLSLMLLRRWGAPWAVLVAGAVMIGTASQHTIIFYNVVGVLALALVTWSFAFAPLLRREQLGWHLVAAAGLFLGGITKINFHLIACAMAVGWVVFAWTGQKSAGWRAVGTLLFIGFFAVVLPVAMEMAWTGASLQQWYYHVIELPALTRGPTLWLLLRRDLYLTTIHNYYGPQFSQTGLMGLLLAGGAAIAAWRSPAVAHLGWRRVFVILASLLAALAGAALLATNNEITYVALAASVVLATSLWLGFGVTPRGGWFLAGLLAPVLVLAVMGWQSAWFGQRSLYGYTRSPRSRFLPAETLGPDFAYLRGLHIPPELVNSLQDAARWRRELPGKARDQVFYGPGLEWLDRIWPAPKVHGMSPTQNSFLNGPEDRALFDREVLAGGTYHYVLVCDMWNTWKGNIGEELVRGFQRQNIGTMFSVYEKLPPGVVGSRPLEFLPAFGGNVNTTLLRSALPVKELADGRRFLGLTQGHGEMEFSLPSNRAAGEAVLKRVGHGPATLSKVHFEIFTYHGEQRDSRWASDAALPAGQDELIVSSGPVEAGGQPLVYAVTVPPALAGQVEAGWRGPTLLDSMDGPETPPMLLSSSWPARRAGGAAAAAILPPELAGSPVFFRKADQQAGLVVLPAGSEVWIKLHGRFAKISLSSLAVGGTAGATGPLLRVIYYKGGRLDRLFAKTIGPVAVRCDAAPPANDGWLGLLADPIPGATTMVVKIESAARD